MGKLLIRTPNHLGDCIMSLSALNALLSISGDEVTLLCPSWAEALYSHFDNCTIIPLEPDNLHGLGGVFRQKAIIKEHKYDSGILLTPSFSSALAFYLGGVKKRYGYPTDRRGLLLNYPVTEDSSIKHRSEKYCHLFEEYTVSKLDCTTPYLPISEESQNKAVELLSNTAGDFKRGFVVISPQAVAPSRRWGSENYAELARRLIGKHGIKVVLLGTKAECNAGDNVTDGDGNIINLCGKTDMETASGIMSLARLFIGNDSGLAHLAAAVNIPLVVLSGADNPEETSPVSDKKTVITKDNLNCISCVKNYCPKSGDDFMRCMHEITVSEVDSAASIYLEKTD